VLFWESITSPLKSSGSSGRGPKRDRLRFSDSLGKYLKYSHIGFQFLMCVGLPIAGGVWLDLRYGLMPLFTLLGLVLGFGAGLSSLYSDLFPESAKKTSKTKQRDSDSEDDDKE